jgi:metal-dependent amidase/aminoacylase/carboxypeptidase family protein
MEYIPTGLAGSTDMGNVSYVLPAIHPVIGIGAGSATHTPEFTAFAASDDALAALLDGAKAMAMTVLDYLGDADLRAEVARGFLDS